MEKAIQTGTVGLKLGELAAMLGGALDGPADFYVARLAAAETRDSEGLAFAEKQKYVEQAKASGVGALLIAPGMDSCGIPAIRVDNPRFAFFMLLTKSDRPYPLAEGIHETAVVDPGAKVDPSARIGPYAVIARDAVIEKGVSIHASAYVGEFCQVRADATILPHAVLLRNVEIGERTVIFPGAVLGSEGFGFVWDGSKQIKIPQVGQLTIGPDCEIGPLCAIDRATSGKTSIGAGTKLDNLVHVAHNVEIGEHGVFAAGSAIAGSSKLGSRITAGGQSAVSDHVTICDDVTLGGRAGVTSNISESGAYLSFPAQPAGIAQRNLILSTKLYSMLERIRTLEEKLAKLEESKS